MGKTYWKQPISTEIFYREEFTAIDRAVWFEIMGRCSNKESLSKAFFHGNKRITIKLNRGQMFFNTSKFAQELGTCRKVIKKSIEKLSKWYSEMTSEKKSYGLIISLKNYDKLVSWDSERDSEGTAKGQRRDSEGTANYYNNNNNNNDKNDKKEYIIVAPEKKPEPKLDQNTRKGEELRIVGENKLVKLTDSEFRKLSQKFGNKNVKTYITQLDFYMEGYGQKNKYKNHYAVLQNWLNRDTQSGKLKISFYDFHETDFDSKEAYELKTNKYPMI